MSNRVNVPSYRRHKQSGQAIVTLPDGIGGRHDVLLGKYGTAESRAEYARVLAEWEAGGQRLRPQTANKSLAVHDLSLAFWKHAEQHYRRPDGTTTRELDDFKLSLRPLCHLYGHTAAADFGPLALKAVRQLLIDGYQHPKHGWQPPLARGVINQRIGRIRRMFRWAVENEIVSPVVLHGLQAVRGLQRGRSAARETEPVKPVPEAWVFATLPFLRPQVAAMVQLQLHSGMRPGEVTIMRSIDIETTGKVWLYRPGSDRGPHGEHKTAYRGHSKVVPLGPRAQGVLRPWLRMNLYEYLFQPREAEAQRDAARREQRKTPMTPSQRARRRKWKPKRAPRDRYAVTSYGRAIARAVLAANTARACDICKVREPAERCDSCKAAAIPHWHPHQLRHTKATEIRREAGLDAARAVLGHRSPQITEVYAEIDVAKAAEVMERLG